MAADGQRKYLLDELCIRSKKVHAELRARYRLDENELIEAEIRDAYKRGLHEEVSSQVLHYLGTKYKSQSEIADFLVVDRTAVSKMKSSRSVKAAHLELVIARSDFALNQEHANRNGLIEAAYYVRKKVISDPACTARMSETDYAELMFGVHNDWNEAFILALMEVEQWIAK